MTLAETPPAIIDIEASGFGRGSYPIEVGFVLPDGTGYCSLIRPPAHWTHWDPGAEQLHHISVDQLAAHGRAPAEVAATLNHCLKGRVVYSDGWANDYSWLARLFDEAGMAPAFRLENLRKVLNDDEAALWHQTRELVLAEVPRVRHRASSDARVIQSTFSRIKNLACATG
jgi:hypothetical protein